METFPCRVRTGKEQNAIQTTSVQSLHAVLFRCSQFCRDWTEVFCCLADTLLIREGRAGHRTAELRRLDVRMHAHPYCWDTEAITRPTVARAGVATCLLNSAVHPAKAGLPGESRKSYEPIPNTEYVPQKSYSLGAIGIQCGSEKHGGVPRWLDNRDEHPGFGLRVWAEKTGCVGDSQCAWHPRRQPMQEFAPEAIDRCCLRLRGSGLQVTTY